MSKKLTILVAMALMVAMMVALSGVAQAAPIMGTKADAECARLAKKTLGPSFKPSGYTFHGGTEGDDDFTFQATAGPDVFCGFGGIDAIANEGQLDAGDIFISGADDDYVVNNNGTFYGGAGNDFVDNNNNGTFYGGDGNDTVETNNGTFYGGAGNDTVLVGAPPPQTDRRVPD